MQYAAPQNLDEALALRASGDWQILAGGTDVYPALVGVPHRRDTLDLSGVKELNGIGCDDDGWRIGALVTWSELRDARLPGAFHALQQAAREVGGVQVQNAGTLAGNLCNASPAADGVPPLLCLDAEVELRSRDSMRRLRLGEFIRGNRDTALQPDEVLTAVVIPRAHDNASTSFVKLGARRYLVISIAMAAAAVSLGADQRIANIAIAVGACSATAQRLHQVEARLAGRSTGADAIEAIHPEDFVELSPIDDIRADAAFRREAAVEIVRRAVSDCLSRAS